MPQQLDGNSSTPPLPVRIFMLAALTAMCAFGLIVPVIIAKDLGGPVVAGIVGVLTSPFLLLAGFMLSGIPGNLMGIFTPKVELSVNTTSIRAGKDLRIHWKIHSAAHRIQELVVTFHGMECSEAGRKRIIRNPFRIPSLFEKFAVFATTSPVEIEKGHCTWTVPEFADPSNGERKMRWRVQVSGKIRFWMNVANDLEVAVT